MTPQPTGTVTLLFSDIEGSTRLLEGLGTERYAGALELHRQLLREAFARHEGYEVGTEGDSYFVTFASAENAVAAAREAQQAIAGAEWPDDAAIRVRMGLHTGEPATSDGNYVGMDVHRAARIMAAAHGGQVLVSETTAALLESSSLRDLGPQRLKDLLEPIRLYQVEVEGGAGEFPPLRSLHRTNLPVPGTPFLGREEELSELGSLLAAENARVVTVTGPGGVGKTRLSLQAAADSAEAFADGVFWVALAPLRDPLLLAATVAQALEVVEHPDRSVTESVIAALAAKRVLLVVDNCEHLLDAVAELVSQLVAACPGLVVACSSRERLRVTAEQVYPVRPMRGSDGKALFVERARAVEPSFVPDEHVPAICAAVDELPLAIELAAARIRLLSAAAIRERLTERLPLLATRDRDRDERQRTLEATIAWSYDLLDPEEQRLLRALSVFAGGCTLKAAETVAGADLDLVESLLDKSLLRHRVDKAGQDRYWLLETIREYALARLDVMGVREAVSARHRDYFCDLGSSLGPGDSVIPAAADVARYESDRANFRIVFSEALERGDGAVAGRLVASLVGMWLNAGETVDSYEPARAALALAGADDRDRGWALSRTGVIADELGRWDEAHHLYGQALEHARRTGDIRLACEACRFYASLFVRSRGDFAQALEWAQRAVDLARESGSEELEDRCLFVQAGIMLNTATDRDVIDTATVERCLTIIRELEPRLIARGRKSMVDVDLAQALFYLGRYSEALPPAQAYLQTFGPASYRSPMTIVLIGCIIGGLDDYETAVTLVSAALRLNDEQGLELTDAVRRDFDRLNDAARRALAPDAYEAALAAGKAITTEEAVELALSYPNADGIELEAEQQVSPPVRPASGAASRLVPPA